MRQLGGGVKRVLDVAAATILLFLTAPIVLAVAIAVRIRLGSPILFRQTRPGWHGRPFVVFKFRSMTDAREAEGQLPPDAARLNSFGQWLRSTSLDELPELWNVLSGTMSLVGPRPLLMEYLPLYDARQARRHEVKPGLTGWAQVNGRNTLSWEVKLELDVWYVENQSFWLDCRILALTAWHVVRRDGINAPGEVTMPRFTGSTRIESQ